MDWFNGIIKDLMAMIHNLMLKVHILRATRDLPLLSVELRKSHGGADHAYQHNLRDFRTIIPQVFWYNAFMVLVNGIQPIAVNS